MELGQSISCVLFYFALVCSLSSRVVHLFQYGCFYVCVPVSTIDLFPQKYVHATSILSAYVLYMYIQNVSYSIIMHNRTFLTEFVYFIYLFCTDFFCFLLFFCLLLFFSILLLFIFLFFFLSFLHSSLLSDLSNPPGKKPPSCPPLSRSMSACFFPSTSLHHTATTSPYSLPLSNSFLISISRRRSPALGVLGSL